MRSSIIVFVLTLFFSICAGHAQTVAPERTANAIERNVPNAPAVPAKSMTPQLMLLLFDENATCSDGKRNGTETDIDCGGLVCAACANGKSCVIAGDCQSHVCTGNVCQVPSCTDGVKNQSETDIDCGGLVCAACANGKSCVIAGDCLSGVCSSGICN
jgi:hypothetical protein